MVVDMNQNGVLDGGDYIDGYGRKAGLYIVHDLTQGGPLDVTEVIYSGGSWLDQDLYYPSDIADMTRTAHHRRQPRQRSQLPVVRSHRAITWPRMATS
jgi:hypothetical protein